MQKKTFIKELKYFPPEQIINAWPSEFALLFLGGDSDFTILPISFYEIDFVKLMDLPLNTQGFEQDLPFISGYLGVVSYDEFCPYLKTESKKRPSRVFRVNKTLVFDQKSLRLFLCERKDPHLAKMTKQSVDASMFLSRFQQLQRKGFYSYYSQAITKLHLKAYKSRESYLDQCKEAIADIRNGRYYQINLLRYFMVAGMHNRTDLIPRFFDQAGPFGAIFSLSDLNLISFSPERFVQLLPQQGKLSAIAFPIKGTIGRDQDKLKDLEALEWLKNSRKDHQELHMIVDLMRNDLNKISAKGTVQVNEAARIKSFKQVYHLEASIKSNLRDGLSLRDFFAKLAPGGSITGAPKEEVMKAIIESEGRNRGYFMGNCFYLDDSGFFDSSILIRTLVSKPGAINSLEYAAGSGIVLLSHPNHEISEIDAKCRVITR
ncbi:MAG: chorismate-binding protein [Oligoflexales bacterium]